MKRITFASGTLLAVLVAGCSKDETGPSTDPVATTVQVISGNSQTGLIGTALPAPLVVKVLDQFSAPLPGVSVFFNPDIGGTTGVPPLTDAAGLTQVTFTLGTRAGTVTIAASAARVTAPGTFTVTATPGPAATIRKLAGDGQIAPLGATLSFPFVIAVKDAFGNNVQGVQVTWSSSASGTLNPATTPTDVAGQAQTTYTLAPTAGVQTITARVAGLADARFLATAN